MVLTDYFAGYGYQNTDQITRNGGDLMLATIDVYKRQDQTPSRSCVARLIDDVEPILGVKFDNEEVFQCTGARR